MSLKIKWVLFWIGFFQIMGYCLGQLTRRDILSWYPTLHKSILTPPNIVFPIVWSILYCMLAIVGYSLWQSRHQPRLKLAFELYMVQVLLNWLWTPLFFYYHLIGASLLCILAIIILTATIILITHKINKISCFLLTPYLIWLMFAGYLNGVLWIFNS